MTIKQLTAKARNKENFTSLQGYIDFCQSYLDFIAAGHLQAVIVARNETQYRFWQYDETADFQITRPINSQLMYQAAEFETVRGEFINTLQNLRDIESNPGLRGGLNNTVYTIQQSIGAALDGLPAGESNAARKINGDLFERLMQLILVEMGVNATSGTVKVPVITDGVEQFKMNYQHDLIISYEGDVKAIGSVKTTSKDRIDKIFMDKFLYSKITDSDLPHIAIFLNDVQRTGKHPKYGVSSTFLPGHFKGYTVKLNPLDGVYYCDIRPNMKTEPIIKDHIKTLDHLLCTDIWSFLQHTETVPIEVEPDAEL
jgi:hypothetical protein